MRGNRANLTPWQPGQSGNPGGRPRRTALTDALREKLDEPYLGDRAHRTNAEVIAEKLVRAATKGNIQAIREIADRVEGRCVAQKEPSERDVQSCGLAYYDALLIDAKERKQRKALAAKAADDLSDEDVSN